MWYVVDFSQEAADGIIETCVVRDRIILTRTWQTNLGFNMDVNVVILQCLLQYR